MSRRSFDDPHGNSDEARQALLDNRCENRRTKRHRTRKRSARLNQEKREKSKRKVLANAQAAHGFKLKVRAYWTGASDTHP